MAEGNIRHIPKNPKLRGLARLIPDVEFSREGGLKMQILRPWEGEENPVRFPAVVFLQGSAWTSPDVYFELPQLAEYARRGYVAASITHRNYQEGWPAPAFLEDAKTAVRFLRAHAEEYSVDPERICFFGTSSGGNTALLMALTGDDARYRTREYSGYSDAVQLAVECFGPTDLGELIRMNGENREMMKQFLGGEPEERAGLIEAMSPLSVLDGARTCPPILILHGDADPLVPYGQSVRMFEALLAAGKEAEMICVDGAPHEGSFWSAAVHEAIMDFLARRL